MVKKMISPTPTCTIVIHSHNLQQICNNGQMNKAGGMRQREQITIYKAHNKTKEKKDY